MASQARRKPLDGPQDTAPAHPVDQIIALPVVDHTARRARSSDDLFASTTTDPTQPRRAARS